MKYIVETTENGVTETLELDGSIYKKEWIREKTGVMRCKQKDFSEQLMESGCKNDYLLEKVEETFDNSIPVSVDDMRDYLD